MKEKRIGIEIRILANLICRCLNELGFNEEHNGLTGPQGLVLGYLYDHQDKDIFSKRYRSNFQYSPFNSNGVITMLRR